MTYEPPPTLAQAVLWRRCELGYTQKELAARAGVALRTVQNIEAGAPTRPLTLAAVSRALEVDASALQRIADAEFTKEAAS